MHVNKVSRVRTIDRVAKDLGEDVDFLFDVAIEMEPEDGLIWVLSFGDESLMAFTDDGVDSLVDPPGNEAPQGVLISASSATPRGPCRTVTLRQQRASKDIPDRARGHACARWNVLRGCFGAPRTRSMGVGADG